LIVAFDFRCIQGAVVDPNFVSVPGKGLANLPRLFPLPTKTGSLKLMNLLGSFFCPIFTPLA